MGLDRSKVDLTGRTPIPGHGPNPARSHGCADVYMTVGEIAAAFRVSKQMAYRLIREKELESVRIGRLHRVARRVVCDRLGNPDEPYWTAGEVAAAFRVGAQTITRMIGQGELEAVRVSHVYRVPDRAVRSLGDPDEPYWSVREVAEKLRVAKMTVLNRIGQGELEAVRISVLLRIPERSVNALISGPAEQLSSERKG